MAVPFGVKCSEGHLVTGLRQRRHQVLRCPDCGANVFVLPKSPFASIQHASSLDSTAIRRSLWSRPLWAGSATLVLVTVAIAALLIILHQKGEATPDLRAHRLAADEAIRSGRLHHAAEELAIAQALALKQPGTLSPAELRSLTQQYREISLLADLLSESLDEILLRASRLPEDEWKAQFQKRYLGPGLANAVVFDAEVRQIGADQYRIDWELTAGNEPARLEIDGLQMLKELPLHEPRRLLFGARLGSIRREQNGVWVVRFEPTSGVLLTDAVAVSARYPGPIDAELSKLLDRQRKWAVGK
jgi:hypothetical protein